MEYEGEEIEDPGNTPEFGAIFMSNMETKRECFRRKILALPPSKASFVKQVRAGMVLFLFEFERRQLFGVYRATSDGGMNISRSPFISAGRHFPAQVCFAPIWECTPLFENEFREAIRENYYTSKKFHFGLSKEQVRHLLQLFCPRKLPPRQLGTGTRLAGNDIDRRWADHRRYSIRERLKMEHCEDDFPSMGMSESSPNSLHRAIEANDNKLFLDGVENGKDINFIRDNYFTDQAGDSLRKRKRMYDDYSDTGFYDARARMQSYGTDNHEISLNSERTSTIRGWFPMAENSENDSNVYASYSPGVCTKYSKASLDVNRRADYDRPDFESPNRHAIDNDRFGGNDTMKTKLNSRGTLGYEIPDELEYFLRRPGRENDGTDSEFIRSRREIDATDSEFVRSRLACKYNMEDDAEPVVPLKNYDNFQHVFNGTSGGSKLLMDERMGTEHNLDNGLGFDLFSEKFPNSFDIDQRMIDERRYTLGNKMMKPNCVGGIHGSTTSYEPSGHSGLDKRKDGGTFLSPVSKEAFPNSLDRFSKSSLDGQSFQLKGPQNVKTSNSTILDSVPTRNIPSAPELTTRYSSATGVDRGASLDLGITYYGCGEFRSLSHRKSCEGEGCDRFDPAACRENNDLHHPYTTQNSHYQKLRSSAPSVDTSLPFPPSTHGSVIYTEPGDLCAWRESLASENHILPPGTQRHIQWEEIEQRNAGCEILSSSPKLTGLGYHRDEQLTNEELEYFNHHRARISNDDYQNLNPGLVGTESEVPRRSVFRRLRRQEENVKDDTNLDDTYMDASVEEVMDILKSFEDIRSKNHRKGNPVVKHHGRDEMVRTEKQASPELVRRSSGTRMVDGTSRAIAEGVQEMPKETREVEFKRRRDLKNGLDENGAKHNALREEDNISRENVESEAPVNKKQMRRKLVRPKFGSEASVDAVSN